MLLFANPPESVRVCIRPSFTRHDDGGKLFVRSRKDAQQIMTDTTPEMKEYAATAGLLPQDMPPANHPLFENDAEVRELGDLVDARSESSVGYAHAGERLNDSVTGSTSFDPLDNEDAYATRADFEDSMLGSDLDSEAGDDAGEMFAGAGMNRMPDLTGTVRGLAPGMATHLPLDTGADGFQIIEPEDAGDIRAAVSLGGSVEDDAVLEAIAHGVNPYDAQVAANTDGHLIPTSEPGAMSADDALDATRRLR